MGCPDSLLAGLAALALAISACGDDVPFSGADAGVTPDGAVDGGLDGATVGPRTIRVTTTEAANLADGLCSLPEAIAVAGGRAAAGAEDCPAESEVDVIELPTGTFRLAEAIEPVRSIEIRGAGMDASTVSVGGDGIACGVRLAVPGETVRLTGLTLRPAAGGGADAGGLTGICVTGGTLRLRHARVTGFTGGGMRAEASPGSDAKLEIYNALVDGNTSPGDGAGIAFIGAGSSISIDQSSIVNNTSAGMGGGIFAWGGTNANYIFNTTISGNVARRGGGIAARILDLTYFGLYWSTIARNRALDVGGGLHIQGDGLAAHGTATASIIAENSADADAAQANLNADWAPGFSCTSSLFHLSALPRAPANLGGSCRFDLADAGLGPLMDMGGADHLPMHALLPGSAAVDAVADGRPFGLLEQRDSWNGGAGDPPLGAGPGETPPWTFFGGGGDRSPLSDMGAYELNPRWEAELLAVVDRAPPAEHAVVSTAVGSSHGAATRLRASAAGDFVTYQVPVPEAGPHAIGVRIRTGSDAGMFQLLVSDGLSGPYLPVGEIQDGYSAAAATAGFLTLPLGTVDFPTFGQKHFKFVVTGRNESSSGFGLLLDYLSVTRP